MKPYDATLADLADDPHPILAAARAEGPITWSPALAAWLITSRATAVAVMRDPDRFTVDDPRFSTARILGPSMLSTDGVEHARHRDPFVEWFADRERLAAITAWMHDEAERLVAAIAGAGRAELRSTIAAPLAANTLARLLGLDPPGPHALLTWYREIVGAVQTIAAGAEPGLDGARANAELRTAILEATDAGRAEVLLRARAALRDDEVAADAAVILFGGIETSEGATATAFWHLLTEPALTARLTEDRSLVPALVEESLRLEPAAATVDRYATVDTDLDGARIRAGDPVIVSLAGANRDPDVFPDPDRLRLDRPNVRQHTTFARGPHACLGIHLARAQTVAALDAVLRSLPGLAIEIDASEPPRGLVFRKPAAVTAVWDRP